MHVLLRIIESFFTRSSSDLLLENFSTQTNKLSDNNKINKNDYSSFKASNQKLELFPKKDLMFVWEATISCFEAVFKNTEQICKESENFQSNSVAEELIQSCQETNIEITGFILSTLIPHSFSINKSMQSRLFTLIDLDFESFSVNSASQTNHSSFSRVCISNLFELCRFKPDDTNKKGN